MYLRGGQRMEPIALPSDTGSAISSGRLNTDENEGYVYAWLFKTLAKETVEKPPGDIRSIRARYASPPTCDRRVAGMELRFSA